MLQLKALDRKGTPPSRTRIGRSLTIARMALQNMQQQPLRTVLLILSVALALGALFASYTVACGVAAGTEQGFARLGADLIVVPEKTLVNITSALLTVQPTAETMNRQIIGEIAHINGVAKATPQTIYQVSVMAGMPEHRTPLVAFDPATDFTISPWLVTHLPRPQATGDLISGGRRAESIGEEIQPCNIPATIYGKLGHSGVGPLDDSLFATYNTASHLLSNNAARQLCTPPYSPNRVSAVLVKLNFGATAEQVRFAISRLPGVKVIQGASVVTATRQSTTVLLQGIVLSGGIMLTSSLILIGLLFAAIIAERRREIGVLLAIGARRRDITLMLLAEAAITTAVGGVVGLMLGCALLVIFENSLVYYLKTLHMDFAWPSAQHIVAGALALEALAIVSGLIAAIVPAWKATQKDPYVLIQGEGGNC